jgi:stage II sporulation protein AA (anti-sigma F factor antagonist)
MKLNVVSIEKELVRVQAEGDITSQDFTADGRNPFEAVLGSRWAAHRVVVDMRAVPFVDSSAIGWLMNSRREFERAGGVVVLHSIQPRVRQILDLLRVGKAVPLVENEGAAVVVVTAAAAGVRLESPTASVPFQAPPAPKAPTTARPRPVRGKARRSKAA